MRLTVLGCSGSVPGPDSPASGYLVRAGGAALVLDLGGGALGALQRECDPREVEALLLSHLHPDHCSDVASLVVHARYAPGPRRVAPLALHAPRGAMTRLAAAYAPSATALATTDLSDVLDHRELGAGPVAVGPVEVRAVRVAHPVEAYALRLEHGGRTLVYTGDTGPCPQLAELADGADLLLAEASWPHSMDNEPGVHLSGRDAGEVAAAARVGRLVLTHVPPWTDPGQVLAEARAVFSGPVEAARAGASYEV